MLLDLDTVIFVSFLIMNLAVGLFYSRNIKTAKEYAIGDRKFSTRALISTTVATCIGAGIFSASITESYRQGLYFIIPAVLGDCLSLLFTGYFLIPRMVEFFGTLSVAEAMGNLYGKHVRIISAVSGALLSIGAVALQFKVAASVMQIFFGISGFYALGLSATAVIAYSSFGGIRSVTFTDVLQFLTFCTIIPLICTVIWHNDSKLPAEAFSLLSHNPLFNISEVINVSNSKFVSLMLLLVIFIIPALDPTFFQRVSMSSGVAQARKSFVSSGLIVALIISVTCWVGVLLFLNDPALDADNLLSYIINNYTYTGLKGLTAACIMAIIMSTADSYINSATILIAHDIIEPLSNKIIEPPQKLLLFRVVALSIGVFGVLLSIKTSGLLPLLIKTLSFYMPIVSVPLLLAIFGFRSSPKVVITGMIAGIIAVTLCFALNAYEDREAAIGMALNLIAFIITHWLSGKPEGKKNLEHENALKNLAESRKKKIADTVNLVRNFSYQEFYIKHYPKNKYFDFVVGILSIATVLASSYIVPKNLEPQAKTLFSIALNANLILSFVFITYSLWSEFFKEKYLIIFKLVAIPCVLVFMPMLFIVIGNFKQLLLMIFLVNIIAFLLLSSWQLVLGSLILFSYASILLYNWLKGNNYIESYNYNDEGLYFSITYILSLLSITFVALLKPRQEEQELTEKIAEHLSHELEYRDKHILSLSNMKQIFIRNLQHETNTPVTGIYSMSQALNDCYDKLSDFERRKAINTIMTSSERLISYVSNLIDVSKILSMSYRLKISKVNLSNMLAEALRKCKKLYISRDKENDREIITNIENPLYAECDEYYIRKSFENLIINAIQYCKKGTVEINLLKGQNSIKLIVKDSGIGIPEDDLGKIFEPFEVSSRTLTPAGGRGMGLTLVKAAIDVHKGSVSVKSKNDFGSEFILEIPIYFKVANKKMVNPCAANLGNVLA